MSRAQRLAALLDGIDLSLCLVSWDLKRGDIIVEPLGLRAWHDYARIPVADRDDASLKAELVGACDWIRATEHY
jgi:hypothetical protein